MICKGPCAKYLRINKAGVITTTKSLDRDNGEIKDVRGVCFVEIEVSFYMMNKTSKFITDFVKII